MHKNISTSQIHLEIQSILPFQEYCELRTFGLIDLVTRFSWFQVRRFLEECFAVGGRLAHISVIVTVVLICQYKVLPQVICL